MEELRSVFVLQAHGSPGAFWESEQESLLFVIEMKSERVQEQNRKLQQMDALVCQLQKHAAGDRF